MHICQAQSRIFINQRKLMCKDKVSRKWDGTKQGFRNKQELQYLKVLIKIYAKLSNLKLRLSEVLL